jgi:hypothetical protein
MRLLAAERFALSIIVALAALDAVLLSVKGVQVDVFGYVACAAAGAFAIAVGQYYRAVGRDAGIALATTAAGLFIIFTLVGSAFNYLLLPLTAPRIDGNLIKIDAVFGYRWADFVAAAAEFPWIGALTQIVYVTSLPQLIIVIVALGFTQQNVALHRFLLTGMVAALLAICFWSVFPSSGPAAYQAVPEAVQAALNLVVGPEYGAELNRLSVEGASILSPKDALGLIAFPSFHTVMALMSVWFMRGFTRVWPLVVAVNIIMLPAILIHGGHHLVDLAGGAVTFGLAYLMSGLAVTDPAIDASSAGGLTAH